MVLPRGLGSLGSGGGSEKLSRFILLIYMVLTAIMCLLVTSQVGMWLVFAKPCAQGRAHWDWCPVLAAQHESSHSNLFFLAERSINGKVIYQPCFQGF